MKNKVFLLVFLIWLASTMLGLAQSSSTNFTLVSGTFVTSSAVTSSTSATLTSTLPTTISGTSSSTTYTAVSGAVIVAYSMTASYSGSGVQVVTPADQLMKVAYVGDTGVASGTFYYRQTGQNSYSWVSMTQGTGDTLEYTCQSALLTIRGLEYYFDISRGTSNARVSSASRPLVMRVELTNSQAQRPSATPVSSYRMASVPLTVSGSNALSGVFPDDLGAYDRELWRLGRWDPATSAYVEYPSGPNVVPGRAYWLITAVADTYGAAGISVRPNRVSADSSFYVVALQAGWNQLANPYPFGVAWSDVLFDDNGTVLDHSDDLSGVIDDVAYYYNGSSYTSAAGIPAWGGVFVNVLKTGVSALFKCRESAVSLSKPMITEETGTWQLELTMGVGEKEDALNFVGVRTEASEGKDRFDFSEPPMAPEGCMLAFRSPDDNAHLLRTDFRPEFNEGTSWDVVLSEGINRRLTVVGIDNIPADMKAWLIFNTGETVRLAEGIEIAIANDVRSGQLVVGKDPFVTSHVSAAMPGDFGLSQNFPNPFNPSTTIRFALPGAAHVELAVYNMLGQKVATVVDGEMDAGHHSVVWDGRNDRSQVVASGVYFYRLNAGGFDQTRKMILVK